MTKLNYKISNGYYELTESVFSESDEVLLNLNCADGAVIFIMDRYLTVKDGKVKTDLSRLQNGKITPSLISGNGVYTLEPFIKEGRKILPTDTEEWVIRRLLERVRALEERVNELQEDIDGVNLELGACSICEPE